MAADSTEQVHLFSYNLSIAIDPLTLQWSLCGSVTDWDRRITVFRKKMRMTPVRDLIITSVVEDAK